MDKNFPIENLVQDENGKVILHFPEEECQLMIFCIREDLPHFYFLSEDHVTCLRLDRAEYFPYRQKNDKMNEEQIKTLVSILNQNIEEAPIRNVWQLIVAIWNLHTYNKRHKVDIYEFPDYSQLNTTRKEM